MVNKILSLLATLIILTGCNQLAMLSVIGSTAGVVASNNAYIKTWNTLDVGTYLVTDKDIKTHVYEKVTTVEMKDEVLTEDKKVLVTVPIIEVEESEIFRPDHNLLLASVSTPLVVDEIWTTKEWNIYSVLLICLVFSNLIFLSSLIYLVIYFLTSTQIDIKIKKRKTKKKRKRKK